MPLVGETTGAVESLSSAQEINNTIAANLSTTIIAENATSPNVTALSSRNVTATTSFDYHELNWTTELKPTFTAITTTPAKSKDLRNGSIPDGGGRPTEIDEGNILVAAIAAGSVIVLFIVCYLCTMMNLCVCRFFMYECPAGKYVEPQKETSPEGNQSTNS